MAIKKSELYQTLWESCDELRGGMDASQYKDYVLGMLFIKYVSDKFAGEKYSVIEIPEGASFADMVAMKGSADIGDRINKEIVAKLAQANNLPESDFPDFNDSNKLGSGKEMVDTLTGLITIFQKPELDFSKNKAEGDDLLGDAYEFLMRHFATESGKSKGQFYTPSEVSRVIAQVIGIKDASTTGSTSVYDPTCGSGSLLLKVADAAPTSVTLYGQEKDVATAGLARMNMILHNHATAEIKGGSSTLASPKFTEGTGLKRFDFVVANPPFSDKRWTSGFDPESDQYNRFVFGLPPSKQGDLAYLQHIIASLKGHGKGACVLPHGVLFRGNAEGIIRKNLILKGYIKAIIGLPANLFYGTGIPACIVIIDKEDAEDRKSIFMMDASKGFAKDGPKNRLREQDIHKIVDTYSKQLNVERYSRLVPIGEIADPKNDFNLNLPRYIDTTEPEDLHDINAHLRGGIPDRDIEALDEYWSVLPSVRTSLFEPSQWLGYSNLKLPIQETKTAILNHPEFIEYKSKVNGKFSEWKTSTALVLKDIDVDSRPKEVVQHIAESLLDTFRDVPLIDAYDVYQHLMEYWSESMQDDCYLIAETGWVNAAMPREIFQVKNKDGKLFWIEKEDYRKGKRRFKSDLIPAAILIEEYFASEKAHLADLEAEIASIEQQLGEMREEHGGDEGLLVEVIEGEGEKQKIVAKTLKSRLKDIGKDKDYEEERLVLEGYAKLLDQLADIKTRLKNEQDELESMLDSKYPMLTEDEIQCLTVDEKWIAALADAMQGELDRVSQKLTGRIRQLAERYTTPLPLLTNEVAKVASKVDQHLQKMGAVWK